MDPVVKVVPFARVLFIPGPTSVRLKRESGNNVFGRVQIPQRDVFKSACEQPLESPLLLFAVPFLNTLRPKNTNVKLDCGSREECKITLILRQVELY